MSNSWQRQWGKGIKQKDVVFGYISIYEGELEDGKFEVDATYLVKERRLAEAILLADNLSVFDDDIKDDDKHFRMPMNEKTIPHLFVTKDQVSFTKKWNRSVATCAYSATDSYLQHWLGRKLDNNDKTWYSQHHLVTIDGLPQEFTFTVIQQLVEVYGCGIKGIQVPRNTRRFGEHNTFIAALGANPFYKLDGATTNEEAYEKLYPEVAHKALGLDSPLKLAQHKREQLSKWKFECVDVPDLGAICMKQFQLNSVGHNGGSNYYGPRSSFNVGKDDQWLMAIKLDELPKIEYFADMNLPEYKIYEGSMTPQFWQIKNGVNGKTLRDIIPTKSSSSSSTYSNGSGKDKFAYYNDALRPLGYSSVDIILMSWKTARELKDGKFPAKGIKIKLDGAWERVDSKQQNLLTDKSADSVDDDKEKILCYPPLCEECQKPPGSSVYNAALDLVCENCGTIVPEFLVPITYLLDDWEPVKPVEASGEDATDMDTDDLNDFFGTWGDRTL